MENEVCKHLLSFSERSLNIVTGLTCYTDHWFSDWLYNIALTAIERWRDMSIAIVYRLYMLCLLVQCQF